MAHPYPPRSAHLPYVGRQHYFLTFCTDRRSRFFVEETRVTLVHAQILRAAREERFEISAYCFMPDHLHLIATGLDEPSDAKTSSNARSSIRATTSSASMARVCGRGTVTSGWCAMTRNSR